MDTGKSNVKTAAHQNVSEVRSPMEEGEVCWETVDCQNILLSAWFSTLQRASQVGCRCPAFQAPLCPSFQMSLLMYSASLGVCLHVLQRTGRYSVLSLLLPRDFFTNCNQNPLPYQPRTTLYA